MSVKSWFLKWLPSSPANTWVWTLHLCTSTVFFILWLIYSPKDVFIIDLNFEHQPGLLIIVPICVIVLVVLATFAVVSVPAILVTHIVWVTIGTVILHISALRTWRKIRNHQILVSHGLRQVADVAVGVDASQNAGNQKAVILDEHVRKKLYPDDRKLGRESTEIRLLKFSPDETVGGPLRFELEQDDIDECISKGYTAFSYHSEASLPTTKIYVKRADRESDDFEEVQIRDDLHTALSQLKKTKGSEGGPIWVDALCINQGDKDEQGTQILRMKAIFRFAKLVIIWIPEAIQRGHQPNDLDTQAATDEIEYPNGHVHPRGTNEETLLTNEYWRRVWIIQEVAVAKKIQIIGGTESKDEKDLDELVQSGNARNVMYMESINNVVDLRRRVKSNQRNDELSLFNLLLRTRASRTTEWQDRVFAILSLSRDGEKLLMDPKYRKSETRQSVDLAKSYMETYRRLDIILLGGHVRNRKMLKAAFPTWCPPFFQMYNLSTDARLPQYVDNILCQDADRPLFSATKQAAYQGRSEGQGTLLSPAYLLGTIDSLGWIEFDGKEKEVQFRDSSQTDVTSSEDIPTAMWNLLLTLSQRDFQEAKRNNKVFAETELTTTDYRRCTKPYKYFMLLAFGDRAGRKVESGRPTDPYSRWICENRTFRFGSYTLHQHARNIMPIWPWKLWKWTESWKQLFLASVIWRELCDLERAHQPLISIAKENMRLMSLKTKDKAVLGLVHPAARIDDKVYLLPGCSVPAVLRKTGTQFCVVGDAIVPGEMFGENWPDYTAPGLDEIEII